MSQIRLYDQNVQNDFLIKVGYEVISAGFFDKSRIKVRSCGARFGLGPITYDYRSYSTTNNDGWSVTYARHSIGNKGRDFFYYGLAISKEIGKRFIVTTNDTVHLDFYNYLMHQYKLPLLREWIPVLLDQLIRSREVTSHEADLQIFTDDADRSFPLNGREVKLSSLLVYENNGMTEESFEEIVSDLLKRGMIRICDQDMPLLEFKGLDDYFKTYGHTIVANLEKEVKPLVPLKGTVDTLALKHKRLFPQQAACVNGINALRKNNIHYGIMNEGMGVGKTIQAASVIDSYHVEKYLKAHPGMTLKDAYKDGVINYRAIIIGPGHLVEKWAEELRKEIPHAKVTILNDLSQLVAIRNSGRKAHNGKEFFVISKDFAKLDTQYSPIPTQTKHKYLSADVCGDCYEQNHTVSYKKGIGNRGVCPECGGKHFIHHKLFERQYGMVCPKCGELLLRCTKNGVNFNKLEEKIDDLVLKPADFASRNIGNSICYHCGAPLWGANSKPIDCGSEKPNRKVKWRKISFDKNKKGKTKDTAFVLSGHESEFLLGKGLTENDYNYLQSDFGPRKVAPAHYIKKYLKGYFSFCVLDECHKFEGAGTAQANAAHALIEASDFTIGLTGTISNGTAASFFYLLFMLEPHRMIQKGFSYTSGDCMRFCQQYGCVETMYQAEGSDGEYNSNSRGRQLSSPRVKPGISPMLFVDFLLDRCVFLDITDLSKYLPPLHEKVVTVNLPDDVLASQNRTISTLKEATHSKEGRSVLTEMLQFGLSYPDKPFGRKPIMSAYTKDMIVAAPDNYEIYRGTLLPKEAELIKIVSQEISEDRNCFIYCSYTGEAETNISERIKDVVEKYCNLKGRVQIIQASSPAPLKREAFIKKKARDGIKVFISNPKCVETGLDFCFDYEGKRYNYPTLIFFQMSYEMSVIWQASRRAYRLNQREECRTYYLAYENTLQTAALQIMAEKQVATSAIQGKFSSEGLASMAKGVDTRTQLAAALAKNDMSDRKTLENMFDVMNQSNGQNTDDGYGDYIPPKTYYELMGTEEDAEEAVDEDSFSIFDVQAKELAIPEEVEHITAPITRSVERAKEEENATLLDVDLFAEFDEIFNTTAEAASKEAITDVRQEKSLNETETEKKAKPKKAKSKKTTITTGQYDLFSLMAS